MAELTVGGKKRARPSGASFDPIFRTLCFTAATTVLTAIVGVLVSLLFGGWPAFAKFGLRFFTSTVWNPVTDQYGGAGPIVGTLLTSTLALILALPLAFGVAVFLTEFCPRALRRPIGVAVELLAGVPSIVYGMWGLFVLAPLFSKYVEIPIMGLAPPGSIWETILSGVPNGSGLIAASVILAIMILPYIAATLRELFLTVPARVRESAYGVGCTSLEVVWSVTLPYVRKSAIGAVMLGLGRALGETMAVTFVIGNSHDFPKGIFDGGSTIASTIANEFAEATSDMHTSALLALGFVLFLITFAVLAIARALLGQKDPV
ncbi:MAG: phosphate ABC transporter permease subunit PstC [Caulobacteraceae bacterium]